MLTNVTQRDYNFYNWSASASLVRSGLGQSPHLQQQHALDARPQVAGRLETA